MTAFRRVGIPLVGFGCCLVGLGLLARHLLADPTVLPPDDFLQYWAAGRLHLNGGNPYDADQLLVLQASTGRADGMAVLSWNPPWALALFAPFGLLPWRPAQLLWVALQVCLIVGSAVWVWRAAGGDPRRLVWVVTGALVAFPTVYLLMSGQCGGLMLVGLAGFYAAVRTGRPPLAGLLALAAVKPHLFLPVWLALALDATVSGRSRRLLGWGMAAGLVMVVVPTVVDPGVWGKYLEALARPATDAHPPLSGWRCPLAGWWVRHLVAPDVFWGQAVPTAVAAVGTAGYWFARRRRWDWGRELPRLVLVGLIAAPYGAWQYDLVVLLVPALVAAAWVDRHAPGRWLWVLAGAVVWNAVGLASTRGEWFVWAAPTAAVGCWLATRPRGLQSPSPDAG